MRFLRLSISYVFLLLIQIATRDRYWIKKVEHRLPKYRYPITFSQSTLDGGIFSKISQFHKEFIHVIDFLTLYDSTGNIVWRQQFQWTEFMLDLSEEYGVANTIAEDEDYFYLVDFFTQVTKVRNGEIHLRKIEKTTGELVFHKNLQLDFENINIRFMSLQLFNFRDDCLIFSFVFDSSPLKRGQQHVLKIRKDDFGIVWVKRYHIPLRRIPPGDINDEIEVAAIWSGTNVFVNPISWFIILTFALQFETFDISFISLLDENGDIIRTYQMGHALSFEFPSVLSTNEFDDSEYAFGVSIPYIFRIRITSEECKVEWGKHTQRTIENRERNYWPFSTDDFFHIKKLLVTTDGGVLIRGVKNEFVTDKADFLARNEEIFYLKLNSDGKKEWVREFNLPIDARYRGNIFLCSEDENSVLISNSIVDYHNVNFINVTETISNLNFEEMKPCRIGEIKNDAIDLEQNYNLKDSFQPKVAPSDFVVSLDVVSVKEVVVTKNLEKRPMLWILNEFPDYDACRVEKSFKVGSIFKFFGSLLVFFFDVVLCGFVIFVVYLILKKKKWFA